MTFFANTNRIYTIALLTIIGLLGFFAAPQLHGQVTGGTIQGTVNDATGAAIPNVDVLITNTSTDVVTTLKTNEAGLYSAPNLLPGPSKVAAKSTGFSTSVVNGIDLTVGAQQAINIIMKVGETSQQVEVSAS